MTGQLERHYGAPSVRVSALNDAGESYWPEMYSAAFLEQKRRADPHLFEAWYQQKPGGGEGDIFKSAWFTPYSGDPPKGELYQSWDTALKAGQENDYSAFVEAVVAGNGDIYLTDFDWQRLEFPGLVSEMKRVGERGPRLVLVEDKVSGTSAIQMLKAGTALPVTAVRPESDKVARARGTTGWLESGKVFFPAHHPKLATFEAFLTGFPLASHDDPVDAFSQLVNYVITQHTETLSAAQTLAALRGAARK